MESAGNPSNAECGGPTWRLVAKTHKGRNNDGKPQAQESSSFDHGLQDERGSGTVQMRNGELIPPSSRRCALPQSPPGEGGPRGCCARPLLGIPKCTKSWTGEAAAERP